MGNTHAKRVFQTIDKDKNGRVHLGEIVDCVGHDHSTKRHSNADLLLEEAEFSLKACALTTLYFFDREHEGSLNLDEFVELDKMVHKIQERVYKKHKRKVSPKRRSDDHHEDHQGGSGATTPVSTYTGHHSLQPSALVKQLERKTSSCSNLLDHDGSHSSNTVKMFTSYGSGCPRMHHGEADDLLYEIKNEITIELLPALKEIFHNQGRLKFLNWLFKISDITQCGKISLRELGFILTTVENDGIDLESLLYDSSPTHSRTTSRPTSPTRQSNLEQPSTSGAQPLDVQPENNGQLNIRSELERSQDVVNRVMREYDTDNKGYLTKEQFFALGELILSQYESHTQSKLPQERVGPWELTHVLGEGAYGIVRAATNIETGQRVAAKIVKRGNVSDMSRLDTEIQAMMMLQHESVVRLYDVAEKEDNIYLIMELCGGGTIYDHVVDKPFDDELARFFFSRLIDGLAYCHSMGVCHRDLRLQNLLLDNNGTLKITDFGQARIFTKGWNVFATQFVGSPYHLTPEQILGRCYNGEKVDVWSAGIILYAFLTSQMPFRNEQEIIASTISYPSDIEISEDAKDLIAGMLTHDPEKRFTIQEVHDHRWLSGAQKQPSLTRYDVVTPVIGSVERTWLEILRVLKTLNVRTKKEIVTDSNNKQHVYYKCLYPAKNLKFCMTITDTADMVNPQSASYNSQTPQLTFTVNLKEGHSLEFRKLVDKLKNNLKKLTSKAS